MSAKYAVLGLAVAATAFLGGIAYSLVALPGSSELPPGVSRVDVALLKRFADADARAQQQQAETRVLLQSLSRGLSSLRAQVATLSAASPQATTVSAADPAASRAERHLHGPARSPESLAQLAGLTKWKSDADLRAKWSSASEDDVRRALGSPDTKYVGAPGHDSLTYLTRDGDKAVSAVKIRMARGRVSTVSVEPAVL
jgi:hypothetical protein